MLLKHNVIAGLHYIVYFEKIDSCEISISGDR